GQGSQRGGRGGGANTARKFCGKPAFPKMRSRHWCAMASPKRPACQGIEVMDFALSASQESIRDAVGKICQRFDDAYWLKKDKEGGYPADFPRALADAGGPGF